MNRVGIFSVFLIGIFVFCQCSRDTSVPAGVDVSDSRQLLQVTTDSWDATSGELILWEKLGNEWLPVGEPIAVIVGRSGLGWGRGLHENGAGPVKVEGDGKAPAGIFELGMAFGYAAVAPTDCSFPYRAATEKDFYVDDVDAKDYNKWVHLEGGLREARTRWNSFEKMKLAGDNYALGIVVEHNSAPVVPGAGSAIFIHIRQEEDRATAGCTGLFREDMEKVLGWLRVEAKPLLIQAPKGVLDFPP